MLTRNTVCRIVGLSSVTDNAGKPHMGDTHCSYILQHSRREVGHLSTTVIGYRTIHLTGGITIAEQACKNLVNYYLIHHRYAIP